MQISPQHMALYVTEPPFQDLEIPIERSLQNSQT